MNRRGWLYGLALLQALGLIALYVWHWVGLQGETFLLRTVPVDPRDYLRGDYVTLNYEISTVPMGMEVPEKDWGRTVFVTFKTDGEYAVIDRVELERPKDRIAVRAKLMGRNLVYDIEKCFVPEGKGDPPAPVTVEIAVTRQGKALIRRLFAEGEPWPR